MNDCYVYALVDPINRIPFYIGKGKDDRAYVHGRPSDKHNTEKCHIIKTLRSLGMNHRVVFIDQGLTSEEAYKRENLYIQLWRTRFPNHKLTNKDYIQPDRTGTKLTPEHKQKISNANKGQIPWLKGKSKEDGTLPPDYYKKHKLHETAVKTSAKSRSL